jgi:hypothetical protein
MHGPTNVKLVYTLSEDVVVLPKHVEVNKEFIVLFIGCAYVGFINDRFTH